MGNLHALLEGAAGLCGGFAILGALILCGWLLMWTIAIKHLPPVQEALGWRRPLKPPRSEKAAEIEALKAEHARIRAALRSRPDVPVELVAAPSVGGAEATEDVAAETAADKKND